MLSLSPLVHSIYFGNPAPKVQVMDVKSDVSNTRTYTFSNCHIGDLGGTASTSGDVYGTAPNIRSSSRKAIAVIVHGEDAATIFNVSSVTIGGVGGTERIDRTGGTIAINTAIYTWDTASLQGITNTDIVVDWSEAVTGCAIGVLQVENIALLFAVATGQTSGTGVMPIEGAPSLASIDRGITMIVGTTCVTGGGTELPDVVTDGSLTSAATNLVLGPSVMLYQGSSAEMDYAAYYAQVAGYPRGAGSASGLNFQVSWSGAGGGDAVMLGIC